MNSSNDLITQLNKQLANWNILYTKLHNYHWYVKGSNFFTLHEKFEEYYNEAATYIDEIAERILTIGGKPIATLNEYINTASIKEASSTENSEEMVAQLTKDFSAVISEIDKLITTSEDANDIPTADMFIGIKTSLEKHVWMLKSFLG